MEIVMYYSAACRILSYRSVCSGFFHLNTIWHTSYQQPFLSSKVVGKAVSSLTVGNLWSYPVFLRHFIQTRKGKQKKGRRERGRGRDREGGKKRER